MVSTIVAAAFIVVSSVLGYSNADTVCVVPPNNRTLGPGICNLVGGIWYQCADLGGGNLQYRKVAVQSCEQNGKTYGLFASFVVDNVRYSCSVTPDGIKTFLSPSGCVTEKGTFIKKNQVVEECPGDGVKCAKVNGLYRLQELTAIELDTWKAANPNTGLGRTDCSPTTTETSTPLTTTSTTPATTTTTTTTTPSTTTTTETTTTPKPATTTITRKPAVISGIRLYNHIHVAGYLNWEQCKEECKKRSDCAALTFNSANPAVEKSICYLYNNAYKTVCESNWHSWFKEAEKKPIDNCVGVDSDKVRLWNDYDASMTDEETCKNKCRRDSNCKATTFLPYRPGYGVCYLFNKFTKATCEAKWRSWFKDESLVRTCY